MSSLASDFHSAGFSEVSAVETAAQFARVEMAAKERSIAPRHRFHVPGRIEVLGKHTDYAGGRSLLTAVERGFAVVSAARNDRLVRLVDVNRDGDVTLSFDEPTEHVSPHWAIYPAAVVRRLVRDFAPPLRGADIVFSSNLPPASGLSSSTALLIATFEALRAANSLDQRDDFQRALPGVLDLAAYLGSVESGRPFRHFGGEAGVGAAGGSQDHTAILASEAGCICQFGYAPARCEGTAALSPSMTFVIGVSGVIAQKTGSARAAYNRAAERSAAVLDAWRAATGRDDATLYEAAASSSDAPTRIRESLSVPRNDFNQADLLARFDQFFDETFVIIPEALAALSRQDLKAFGSLVDRSQKGAEKGLNNQVAETITLAQSARSLGAHAASAFGAGFGGSVWALVNTADADAFSTEWERAYRERFDHPQASFFRTNAGPPLLRLSV